MCCIDITANIGNEIGLRQHDDRRDVDLKRQGNVALQARDIEILITGLHDEDRVDIGHNICTWRSVHGAQRLMRLFRSRMRLDRGRL